MDGPYAEVIGDPIAHSKSPLIHNFWLQKLGIEGEYRATCVRPDELRDYFESRRADPHWRGCNVTMPLKERVAGFVDHVEEQAQATGAINCVVKADGGLFATNTDVWGLFLNLGMFEAKDPVIVIGTGGAARATLHHLQGIGALEVHVFGRSQEKAKRLLDEFELYGEAWTLEDRPEILLPMRLINASPLGMSGYPPMPEPMLALVDSLSRYSGVLDMVYDPVETELLARARARNLMTANGLAMLVDQARYAFELFFGAKPGPDMDLELFGRLTS